MASRAFFRCRACGEPVVAGAYRCPVCGIDFPSGTPGAPRAARSPADAPMPPPRERREPEGPARDDTREGFSQSELTEALSDALSLTVRDEPPLYETPPEKAEATRPAEGPAMQDTLRAEHGEPRTDTAAGALNLRPTEADARGNGEAGALKVRPAQERAAAGAEPSERAIVVTEAPERAVTKRRRSVAGGLVGTVLTAMVLIGAVAAVALFANLRNDGAGEAVTSRPVGQSIAAEEGWVSLPAADHARTISATGPFRVRVDGEVFTLTGERTVRLPAETTAAVRVVRSPTVATVARAP